MKRLRCRTKRTLHFLEPQHWIIWLVTALHKKVCPALSHVPVTFTSPTNFWSKGLPNTINTMHRNITTSSWSQNPRYRDTKPSQHQMVSHEISLISLKPLLKGRSSFLVWRDGSRSKFPYINTLPGPERSPMRWRTTPAGSKGVAVNLSLAKEFCIWPILRLYITPERPGLPHATTSSFCTCLGTAKQAWYALRYLPTSYVVTSFSTFAACSELSPAVPSTS